MFLKTKSSRVYEAAKQARKNASKQRRSIIRKHGINAFKNDRLSYRFCPCFFPKPTRYDHLSYDKGEIGYNVAIGEIDNNIEKLTNIMIFAELAGPDSDISIDKEEFLLILQYGSII